MSTLAPSAHQKMPQLDPGEFRYVTKALNIEPVDAQGHRRFKMVMSSTIRDQRGDRIMPSAIEKMAQQFREGRTIFLNHQRQVPEDVFGTSDWTEVRQSDVVDDQGRPVFDLHVAGVVNQPNPRAAQLADSMEGGYVKFGASIGVVVNRKGVKKNDDGGLDVYDVDAKEGSIVGIPMNQRSWVYKAADAVATLDEEDDEDEEEVVDEAETEPVEAPPEDDPTVEHEAVEVDKADLSAKDRSNLDASEFACPEKRLYPINDAAHVRAALSRVADSNNDQCGKDKIIAAARRMGIGEHDKSLSDDDLLLWALTTDDGAALQRQDLNQKADACPDCGGSKAGPKGDCKNAYHDMAEKSATNDDEEVASGVQESAAETPETTPADDGDASDPVETQKLLTVEADDISGLITKLAEYVSLIDHQRSQIETLTRERDDAVQQRDLVKAEVEPAKEVIAKVLAMPLRPKTVGFVAEFADRFPQFDPEIANYLNKRGDK